MHQTCACLRVCVCVCVCMRVCVFCDQEGVSQGETHLLYLDVLGSEISPNVESSIVWFVIVG